MLTCEKPINMATPNTTEGMTSGIMAMAMKRLRPAKRKRTSPMAAAAPTRVAIAEDPTPSTTLFHAASRSSGVSNDAPYQAREKPLSGKVKVRASLNEKTTSNRSGTYKKNTNTKK